MTSANRVCFVIHSDKCFLVTIVRCDRLPCKAKETLFSIAPIRPFIPIEINLLINFIFSETGICSTQCILQIHLILIIIVIVGKFCITKCRNFSGRVSSICHFQAPYLIYLIQRHIVHSLGLNSRILCRHLRIGSAMTDLTLVLVKGLAHWLPGSGPEIPILVIPEIKDPRSVLTRILYLKWNLSK